MEEAGQALLYDRIKGNYVVVRVGDVFQGFTITTIERDQLLLTTMIAPARHYVLPRISEIRTLDHKEPAPAPKTLPKVTHLKPGELHLINPYAGESPLVIDPYPDSNEIKSVQAPAASRVVEVGPKSPAAPPATASTKKPVPDNTTPPVKVATGPATVVAIPKDEVTKLSRQEFDDALADFHTLAKEIQLAVSPKGVHIAELADGTFFHRLGFRKDDHILRVAGRPVTNLDAAASVYARLMRSDEFTAVVSRDKHELTLRFRFAK